MSNKITYTEQEIREHGHHYQPYTTCPICSPEDPRDAVIRELRREVDRLASALDAAADRLEAFDAPKGAIQARSSADSARKLLQSGFRS